MRPPLRCDWGGWWLKCAVGDGLRTQTQVHFLTLAALLLLLLSIIIIIVIIIYKKKKDLIGD